jgi:hypothetical protein
MFIFTLVKGDMWQTCGVASHASLEPWHDKHRMLLAAFGACTLSPGPGDFRFIYCVCCYFVIMFGSALNMNQTGNLHPYCGGEHCCGASGREMLAGRRP